jgi:chromate transporter
LLAWGGPVAQIAMIQRELVEEERWVEQERFRRALAVYQVLPGPEAHEMCVWFGMLARGRIGAVLAGLGFMVPGFVLMFTLSALYVGGALRAATYAGLFLGMQAAVIALIGRALHRIGRHALHDRWLAAIAVAAAATGLLGVQFALALSFCGLAYLLLRRGWWWGAAVLLLLVAGAVALTLRGDVPIAGSNPEAAATAADAVALFGSGLRAGLLTFGGAYTAIPFLQHDMVVVGGFMTNDQFLDGLALSGVLPAPLIIFGTFDGYVAGGAIGSLCTTAGIFLPAFCFTLLGHGLFERLTGSPALRNFLDGVAAGVVGIMAATSVELAGAGITDVRTACIAAVGLVVLFAWRSRAATAVVVIGGGAAGWLLFEAA